MSSFDFSEIRIIDDNSHVKDVIKEIIESKNQSDPFHVLDVGELVARHKLWLEKMPRVIPHYGNIIFFSILLVYYVPGRTMRVIA